MVSIIYRQTGNMKLALITGIPLDFLLGVSLAQFIVYLTQG